MRILIYVIIGTVLLSFSCSGTKKQLRKNSKSPSENIVPKNEQKQIAEPAAGIREIEEKLVPINEKLPDSHRYFVIVGSFKSQDNAKKYQGEMLKKGFRSEILKNEAGLFRISVMATDEIDTAREDIRRIRRVFPEHYDTWLLIQKK